MAFTNSLLVKSVMGNQRVHFIRATADAATGSIASGFDVIEFFGVAIQSATTAAVKFAMNEATSGTASVGNIAITGAASGDEYMLTIYGR